MLLSLLLFIIFTLIALLHFYWAVGGKWGLDATLPTNSQGERLLSPGPFACTVVGLGLSTFAFIYLEKSELISNSLPEWLLFYSGWIIPSIFLLRAIGDGKMVGFFKRIKDTHFAKMDTRYFSPFCLFLALSGFAIQLY